jgi:hypothetical protein
MPAGRLLACSILVLATAMLGCRRDLGECNLDGTTPEGTIEGPAAFDLVYRLTDGLPMYEGQALVQSTCGDGAFCHAPLATGADRIGAPAGLNFDVSLACVGPVTDCQTPPYEERVSRLQGEQSNVQSSAEGMMQEMREGAMPPGEAGRRVRNTIPWLRPDGTELPSIESDDGREIVRNWLACQAPVVGRTEIAPSEDDQLEPCGSPDDEVTCIYSGPAGELPEPQWSEIYWSIVFIRCVECHGPENDNVDQNPDNPLGGEIPGGKDTSALEKLNLTGNDVTNTTNWPTESWSAVVGVSASTAGPCAGQGFLVEASNSASSIMVEKMRGEQTCGLWMPLGGLLPSPQVDVVAEWVELGAPND